MRIIGIKLLNGEKPVIKNLRPGKWYPFGDYQEPTSENGWRWNKDDNADRHLNRLYKSSADSPDAFSKEFHLSVCCIVGKNGSGKSTLLDLMFRIINNYAYKLLEQLSLMSKGQPSSGHCLSEAKGFAATLYFETDNKLGYITYEYGNIKYAYYSIHKQDMEEYSLNNIRKRVTPRILHFLLNDFFYTICSNYSIYSFNKNDYETNNLFNKEGVQGVNGNWIQGLLHKNDGYLTPIVITPYRDEEGYIDINNEETLAEQRLSTLAVLFWSQKKWFMGEYSAAKIAYQFDEDAQMRYEKKFEELVNRNLTLNAKYPEAFCSAPLSCLFKEAWCNYLDNQKYFINKSDKKLIDTVVAYLCYKTLKICLTYPAYGNLLGFKTVKEEELKKKNLAVVASNAWAVETTSEKIEIVIRRMAELDKDNHILLKLRQCLTYLKRDYFKVDSSQHAIGNNDTGVGLYIVGIDKFIQDNLVIDNNLNDSKKEQQRKKYHTYDEVFLRMPPSIFKWEVSFRKRNSNEEIPLDKLSSGERQILQEFSYLLYHIKNIESVESDNFRQHYHHVNIVLDEAELYFHPEFQRQMVANLIDMMSWCHIDNRKIRSANIMIVTHSPFVLSDIPANRILYLEEGEKKESPEQTFAANYHDLLYNQFIVRTPMGAVAEKAIKIIDSHYRKEKTLKPEDYAYHEYIANSVSERYVRKYLCGELKSIAPNNTLDYEENNVPRRWE